MGIKWWALKYPLYSLSFVSCFPLRGLTVHAGTVTLGKESHEYELPMAPCCMLEDVPLWNALPSDPGTGFAQIPPPPPPLHPQQEGIKT